MKRSAAALLSLILALSALTVPAYAETAEQTAAKAAAASTSVEPEKIEYNENATYGEFLDSVKDTPDGVRRADLARYAACKTRADCGRKNEK